MKLTIKLKDDTVREFESVSIARAMKILLWYSDRTVSYKLAGVLK